MTEPFISEELEGLRVGGECVKQIFLLEEIVKTVLDKSKVLTARIDYEEPNYKLNIKGLWQIKELTVSSHIKDC